MVRHLSRLLVPPHRDLSPCRTRQSRSRGPLPNDPDDLRVREQDDCDWNDVLQNRLRPSGVNFINLLRAAFLCADPKRAKKTDNLTVFLALSEYLLVHVDEIDP
jgi:hypothetical protein